MSAAPPSRAFVRPGSASSVRMRCALAVLLGLLSTPAFAQWFPTGPVTTAGGRLTVSGEASASISPDDEAYFDFSGYDYNLLRMVRVDGLGVFRLNTRVSFLADLRVEGPIGGEGQANLRAYAAFARIRPWTDREISFQAGLIPPVFGAFSRRSYSTDNPLIGFPLAYQYLTSLRPDAIPASADDLLRMRGLGWEPFYQIGSSRAEPGVPLVDGLNYEAGVEVRAGNQPVEAALALTINSLSSPIDEYGVAGPHVSGRVALKPRPGLVLGVSGSLGSFVTPEVTNVLSARASSGPNDQRAFGFDAEYSFGYWLLRTEGVLSLWRLPAISAPFDTNALRAFAMDVEARYRLRPGLYVAGRVERLDFNEITGTAGTLPWDAPVRRIEVGGGYSVRRNVVLKGSYQYNWRDGVVVNRTAGLVSAQVLFWF